MIGRRPTPLHLSLQTKVCLSVIKLSSHLECPLPLEVWRRVGVVKSNLIIVSLPLLVIYKRGVSFLYLHELLLGGLIVFIQVWMV